MELEPSLENIKKIGVYVDVQGFYISSSKTFHAREIAIAVPFGGFRTVVSIDPELPTFKKINWRDRITINYVKANVHGLSLTLDTDERSFPNSKIPDIIQTIGLLFTNGNRPFIAINNQHLGRIMKNHGVQYVNLETILPKRTTPAYLCPRHLKGEDATWKTCSLSKVNYMDSEISMLLKEATIREIESFRATCINKTTS